MHYSEYDNKISATLKAIRKLRGFKQIVVAAKLRVDDSTYSRMENGQIVITLGQLHEITKVIGIDVVHLLAINEANQNGSKSIRMLLKHDWSSADFRIRIQKPA